MEDATAFQTGEEFDVALSYASEDGDYVKRVAQSLISRGIRVFYDANEEVALWGKPLSEELHKIYSKKSHAVVMFVSESYAAKAWTRFERRSALERAIKEDREYILQARFDKTMLDGLPSDIACQDASKQTPKQLAARIREKLKQLGIISQQSLAPQRECKHPYLTIEKRTRLADQGLPFWIDHGWKNPRSKSWTKLADVLVRVDGPVEEDGPVFLIPSGTVPPSLSDPKCWGTTGLERKRELTNLWCEANCAKQQFGYVFGMTNRQGKTAPRVYCDSYDRYLIENM